MSIALTDPVSVLIDASLDRVYVATQGVDRMAVLDGTGAIQSRTELSAATGPITQSRARRGNRGLAAHPSEPLIYVFNFLQNSITLFHTQPPAQGEEMKLGFDPTPRDLKLGRKYGYDAKLSGNGTQACSSCHVDGESDFLAWDLGQPWGELVPPPVGQPPPFDQAANPVGDRHPMKGPMVTQSLRGLSGHAPYHWRGDRPTLESFNLNFAGILGGPLLVVGALEPTVLWLDSIALPPNPNRGLDGALATLPAGANQQAGFDAFVQDVGGTSCVQCHAGSSGGSNGMIIGTGFLQASQPMKVAQLRNLYRRQGGGTGPGPVKSGFGFGHDGSAPTLAALFAHPLFDPWPSDVKDDLAAYVLAFDTGTAPIVGWQVGVDADNAQSALLTPDLALLEARTTAGDCDLVLKGTLDGAQVGMVFDPVLSLWSTDRASLGPYTTQELRDLAAVSRAEWLLTTVPPGTGQRSGIDRDRDGALDGEDGLVVVGAPVAGCVPGPTLAGNVDPRIGTAEFALVVAGAPPASAGNLLLIQEPPIVLVANKPLVLDVPVVADADGFVVHRLPIGDDPTLLGTGWRARAVFDDGCGGTTGTNELVVTIGP
jgi:mono/diheme cytochrome c family protein